MNPPENPPSYTKSVKEAPAGIVRVRGPNFWRNWIGFFIAGTINNFGYVVVISAAKSIAESFGHADDIGMINWADVGFGFIVKGANTFFLDNVPYKLRFIANGSFLAIGLVGVAFSKRFNFVFLLVSVIFVGMSSSFGESVILGYLRIFDPDQVGGWSSGTGMAGIGGAAVYLGLVALGLSNDTIFLVCLPLVLVYWGALFVIVKEPPKDDERRALILNVEELPIAGHDHGLGFKETTMGRIGRCTMHILWPAIQLALVYFFEYVVSVGCAAKSVEEEGKSWVHQHAYVVLSFCYQFGVFVSRSSLSIIKIRRIEILTIAQGLNLALWMLQVRFKMIESVWVLFALMVFVGLMGGAMYVNTFYIILNDETLNRPDRELCVNIVALFITLGITVASAFQIFMAHTFFKNY